MIESKAELPAFLTRQSSGEWRLAVWVQPGAKKAGIAGEYQGSLRVRIAAPAVDNKANRALTDFIAKRLGLKRRQVSLASGHTSRKKVLLIESEAQPRWKGIDPQGA